ncbi:MAG: hypothetical protein QOI59_6261 [Gammaproteobacteria bacterium]|nr:hypothetical protein [Gammaproteobacteria bacterium]
MLFQAAFPGNRRKLVIQGEPRTATARASTLPREGVVGQNPRRFALNVSAITE